MLVLIWGFEPTFPDKRSWGAIVFFCKWRYYCSSDFEDFLFFNEKNAEWNYVIITIFGMKGRKFILFSSNYNSVFCKLIIIKTYWWVIKNKSILFWKRPPIVKLYIQQNVFGNTNVYTNFIFFYIKFWCYFFLIDFIIILNHIS